MRLIYYARGGGHGHVLRGLAILTRLGRGLLIGPHRLADWARQAGVDYLSVGQDWAPRLESPDLLLVDVFPRGVVGELQPMLGRCPAWLVSRWVRPEYYLHPPVRAAIEQAYEQILWGEESPPGSTSLRIAQCRVGPILLGAPALSREAAQRALGAPERPVILGLGSGPVEQQASLRRLLGKIAGRLNAALRFVSHELPGALRLFPAAPYLAGADAIVAAGGYHAFHEICASGVPAVFLPQGRPYDDQGRRVRGWPVARTPAELEAWLRRLLGRPVNPHPHPADGAQTIVDLVQRRMQEGVLAREQAAATARFGHPPGEEVLANLSVGGPPEHLCR